MDKYLAEKGIRTYLQGDKFDYEEQVQLTTHSSVAILQLVQQHERWALPAHTDPSSL